MPRPPLTALTIALSTTLAATLPAAAQQVPDQAEAKRMLFPTRSAQMTILRHAFLTDTDVATLREMPKVAQLKYYGALAAAPEAGLQAEATRGAFNFHSVEAARAAAVSGCNAARQGGPACVVVAEILPRDYEAGRQLTLNQDASRAVDGRDFRRAGADAALAVSSETGAWGLGDGGQAAVATCAAQGAQDCQVAVSR